MGEHMCSDGGWVMDMYF